MQVLVTGGAGFIGSHVCELLLARGYRLRVLDNLSEGDVTRLPVGERLELWQGDIRDPALCLRACQGMGGVFHLAALSRVGPSLAGPQAARDYHEQNVGGTLNILEAARAAGVGKLIYSGSSTAYGLLPPPHREDLLPDPLNPYALTKLMGEQYALLYDRLYDFPCVVLRYFQVGGPRQPSTGPYALATGAFVRQKKAGEPLTIHGDGSQRRDFVHVRDVAEANIRAFESPVRGRIVNIGTGVSHSIRELADLISPNQVSGLPRRPADADCTEADITACRELLGWTPQISLREMVEELIRLEGA